MFIKSIYINGFEKTIGKLDNYPIYCMYKFLIDFVDEEVGIISKINVFYEIIFASVHLNVNLLILSVYFSQK